MGPSWPPTWAHLGAQDGPKSEKMGFQNFWVAPPCSFVIRSSFRTSFKTVLASILGGSGLDFRRFLDDLLSFLAYFGHAFGCSCWGGYAPPDPPDLDWVFVFLGQFFSKLCSKIQETAEDKAENPRTCRGQGREQNPYEHLPENSNLKALFFQSPSLTATLQTPKTLGGGTPPQGGFNNISREIC